MKIIAHRGARVHEPENTLAAFQKAIDLGADAIELDIYALRDGHIAVIHDITVDRTTDGHGYVVDFDLPTIKALDAGNGQQVPTLAEVIELVNRRIPLIIELRDPGCALPLANILTEFMKKGWHRTDFEVISFNHVELQLFKNACPTIGVGGSLGGVPTDLCAFSEPLEARSVMLCLEIITQELVDDAKRRGLAVYGYPSESYMADTPLELLRIMKLGVDGLVTDRPDIARQQLDLLATK